MTLRFTLATLCFALAAPLWLSSLDRPLRVRVAASGILAAPLAAQAAQASQTPAGADLAALIGNLASLDYSTRNTAARLIRRAPEKEVVPALAGAAREHSDEFVRYRALVLLTAFGNRGTRDLMVSLLRDRNDRVREVAYKWLEQNPDPRLTDTLLAALQSEQAEFVRPALIAALAALDESPLVQRALVTESGRGLDFFREAVIEALGRQRAAYAVQAIASISKLDGPLRQTAILALGRIGGTAARAVLADVAAAPGDAAQMVRAARCLAGEACDPHLEALRAGAADANPAAVRASVAALAAIATGASGGSGPAAAKESSGFTAPGVAAVEILIALAGREGLVRDQAALAFSTVALRRPDAMVAWLDAAPEAVRTPAVDLLKNGFERLEEDFAEEQFYAAARAAYWKAAEGSPTRTLSAAIIQRLEF